MKNYIVYGKAYVDIEIEVEANSKEEAIEKAYDECCDLENYAGNGGCDKIVGTDVDNMSIAAAGLDWEDAEEN